MTNIRYSDEGIENLNAVCDLYTACFKERPRPVDDHSRIRAMLDNASFLTTAWHEDTLVGLCRCLSDLSYVTYVADLAIHPDFRDCGIGKELLRRSKEKSGTGTRFVLLANSTSGSYYEKLGFEHHPRAWELFKDL